jgi:hypothetical protein
MDQHIETNTATVKAKIAPTSFQSNTRGWKVFANLINTSWRKGAEAFVQTGRYLIEAKEELDRDQYNSLIKLKLAFDESVAKKLICIARKSVLGAHVHQLPPCWSTLYELSQLEDKVLEAKLADGTIHPGMQRKDATALRRGDEDDTEGETSDSQTEPSSTLKALRAAWKAASRADHCQLHDDLGRAGLIATISPELLADIRDHILGQLIATASKSSKFAVASTGRLHVILRCAEQPEPSDEDIRNMIGAGRAIVRDAEKRGIARSNVLVTEGRPIKRK